MGEEGCIYEKIAFCYVYPLEISQTNGICTMPITSNTGKLIARFKGKQFAIDNIQVINNCTWLAQYFITKPYEGLASEQTKLKSKIRSHKSWQVKKNGYDIGHRGAGSARRRDHNEKVLENTVDSFNYAFKKVCHFINIIVNHRTFMLF